MHADLLITGITQLATPIGPGPKHGAAMNEIAILEHAAIAVTDGRFVWTGAAFSWSGSASKTLDLGGRAVVPGLIDPHTHAVWAGDRLRDFDARTSGVTYEQILAAGGGIRSTVNATVAATNYDLTALAEERIWKLIRSGATVVEVKSGYGLTVAGELKMLEVIQSLAVRLPIRIVPTLLIHIPPAQAEERPAYVEAVCSELIPEAARRKLAHAVDVFIEKESWSAAEAETIFASALDHGLQIKAHVEQFHSVGGLELALRLGALSTDHLEAAKPHQFPLFRDSSTIATVLPGVSLHLGIPNAPGRALIDAGAAIAVGTDLNPGSSPLFSTSAALGLAVRLNGLTMREALTAGTANAAQALGLIEAGRIEAGQPADFLVLESPDWHDLLYTMGTNPVREVWCNGQRIVDPAQPGVPHVSSRRGRAKAGVVCTAFRPSLLYRDGSFHSGASIVVSAPTTSGAPGLIEMWVPHPTQDVGWANPVARSANFDLLSKTGPAYTSMPVAAGATINMTGKALLPGFVNTHSHAFQRLIRGKSESRAISGKDFWSWRNTMYHAAAQLSPEDVYDVARMCYLEMVRAGATTVGEFHYVHTAPDGTPYDDPNLLAKQVIAAAQSVGIRIVLLNSAYLRAGYQLPPDPGQRRFYETRDAFLANTAALLASYPQNLPGVTIGVAPHSIRAVPLDDLHAIIEFARSRRLPIHMHVAEQLAENRACADEYGATPVALLAREGLLARDFVAVHAIHISDEEIRLFADANAIVCSCPTTERNLGDGIVPADALMRLGVRHALGSDSQAQIDPLEDARQLDYHLRLQQQQRAILDQIRIHNETQPLAARLLDCATRNGAQALGLNTGSLQQGEHADFITVDCNDLSIAGHAPEDLLPLLVFGLNRTAVRDVFVNGRKILQDAHHPLEDEIVAKYQELHRKVWGSAVTGATR